MDVTQWSKHLCSTGKSLDFIVIMFMGEGTLGEIIFWSYLQVDILDI